MGTGGPSFSVARRIARYNSNKTSMMLDVMSVPYCRHDPADRRPSPASHPAELPALLQKNIFAARLTQSGIADFSLYGLWAVREALEGDNPYSPACPLQYSLPIAHAWIANAGETLIKLNDDRGAAGRGGSLWHGQRGFCVDRWRFWKERLDTLSRSGDLDSDLSAQVTETSARIEALLNTAAR